MIESYVLRFIIWAMRAWTRHISRDYDPDEIRLEIAIRALAMSKRIETYHQKIKLPKILIPMIRRTFPVLIASEIVGVQPMSGPTGDVFALRYTNNNVFMIDSIPGLPKI